MATQIATKLAALDRALDENGPLAVAVSGGVDSLTLARAAARRLGTGATMFHAVSPAVPPEATARTRSLAERYGWRLEVIDAGEFTDPDYLRNPVDRCFHCKLNLYDSIARHTAATIVSGTNTDDLGDFRPGLEAASRRGVRHPYVESGIDKALVRAIAAELELGELADLPASPCLSSRIETGIRVTTPALKLVHAVEQLVGQRLAAGTVRCRVRRSGIVIELDEPALERALAESHREMRAEVERLGSAHGYAAAPEYARYRMGSAFLRKGA